jgi:class 3 adenylate cyclase/tetratricopeptide (TPR) repeat protein
VLVCASCGHENSEGAKFCEECGFSFAAATAGAKEQRKTVTVLFCDLTGSTALGETLDPERLRALLARYFKRMKAIVERHGGSVEKFIGDAVVAVFGVPVLHEDDALRAVRSAVEMRDALPEFGLQGRIGVMTGEVVTGTEERLATGDAVNVAARLEQAAQPGELLIGAPTLALVGDAAEVESVEPLVLKGKAEPVPAFRLLRVRDAPERRHEALFVGRERELALVREAWERVQAEQRCELVTVLGDAGVGKSRLVAEVQVLASVEATVVRGRCLPYGEGITYWPVVEVLKQLDLLPPDDAAAVAIRSLLGETEAMTSADEIAWAFRKTLEHASAERPLVVVFDDIQWGEETFLDLIEHVALLSSGASILLLCMARPELTERRSAWPVTLRLEPLGDEAVEELIPERISGELRDKIAHAAGGNPLFIEEMLAMAGEAEGEVVVPPTLRALLAARLDQLETAERSVLERGSIEGEIFHRGAVQALAPEETQVIPRLAALVRKELIRPDTPQLAGEDGFRFRHLLIRDAAYEALPKATRAELHERFADWLHEHGADLVEQDEIVGYHLEQAAGYKVELGQPDAALALRAGERLAAASRRVLRPGDHRTPARLLERALTLTRPFRLDVDLELLLSAIVHDEDLVRAAAICDTAAERARAEGDERGETVATIAGALHRFFLEPNPDLDGLERASLAAIPLLEAAHDHVGLMYMYVALGYGVANGRGRMEDWASASEAAVRHARAAGLYWGDTFGLTNALMLGPRPADEALKTLDEFGPDTNGLIRSYLLGALNRLEEAWEVGLRAAQRYEESGDHRHYDFLAELAALEGDFETAVRYGRQSIDGFKAAAQLAFEASYSAKQGRWLCLAGRPDEAEPLADFGRTVGGQETEWLWRQVKARVLAHRGEHVRAEALAREAIAIVERTDALTFQGDAFRDLAEVLLAAGRTAEAAEAFEEALSRYERKKNLAMVAQVRLRLAELQDAAPR